MKAAIYNGPYAIELGERPDPTELVIAASKGSRGLRAERTGWSVVPGALIQVRTAFSTGSSETRPAVRHPRVVIAGITPPWSVLVRRSSKLCQPPQGCLLLTPYKQSSFSRAQVACSNVGSMSMLADEGCAS
jgi:hypothetical protein